MSRISPTGVMADIDPLGWGSVTGQRARLERRQKRDAERMARRQRPRGPRTRRWPPASAFSERFRQLIAAHRPIAPQMPAPVGVYAGRYESAIMWREDTETFAAYLTDTNRAGELEARWVGTHPAQYPTVESLAEALAAYGVGLDQGSLALAEHYQQQIWATAGACHIAGTTVGGGQAALAVVTPKGQVQPLVPAPQRDSRSLAFGPVAVCAWGENNGRGALEAARILLDYTDSTTRTDNQLFHDARTLAATTLRHLPPTFSISLADLHTWSRTRSPIPVATAGATIDRIKTQPPPPTTERAPMPGPPPHPEVVRLHAGPTLGDIAAATLAHATDATGRRPPPIERPPKRRPIHREPLHR